MNEEIKEILDDLGNKDNYIEEFGYQYKRISLYDSFQLLDYITNLQQENEILNNIINDLETYLNKVIETSAKCESITCTFVLRYLKELKENKN